MKMLLTILGIGVIVIGIFVCCCGAAMIKEARETKDAIPAYTVVCDGHGNHSFIERSGKMHFRTFATKTDAQDAANGSRKWDEEYDAGLASGRWEREKQVELERLATFKPCP